MYLLERVLEAWARKQAQQASALQGINQKEREREREYRKKDAGTQALMEQRCFNQHTECIYTVLQGGYFQQR